MLREKIDGLTLRQHDDTGMDGCVRQLGSTADTPDADGHWTGVHQCREPQAPGAV